MGEIGDECFLNMGSSDSLEIWSTCLCWLAAVCLGPCQMLPQINTPILVGSLRLFIAISGNSDAFVYLRPLCPLYLPLLLSLPLSPFLLPRDSAVRDSSGRSDVRDAMAAIKAYKNITDAINAAEMAAKEAKDAADKALKVSQVT